MTRGPLLAGAVVAALACGDDNAGARIGRGDMQRGEQPSAAGAEDEDIAGEFVDGEHQSAVARS